MCRLLPRSFIKYLMFNIWFDIWLKTQRRGADDNVHIYAYTHLTITLCYSFKMPVPVSHCWSHLYTAAPCSNILFLFNSDGFSTPFTLREC